MDQGFWDKVMDNFRDSRTRKLKHFAQFFPKIGITANRMTIISFLFGLLSVYFLFNNQWLFLLFAVLHLLCDGLDGVIARYTQTTEFGKYLDFISDRLVALALMLKLFYYLDDYYVLIALALMLLTHGISLLSKFENRSMYSRTVIYIGLVLGLFWSGFYIATYLAAGGISLYSLTVQFRRFLETRVPR